jgi:Putative DNA-binding domain
MIDEAPVAVTESDLLSKISDTENNFIERKTVNDTNGWLKTAVAFANSCPVGQPGILYVGVDDNGMVQKHAASFNFENLQKTISGIIGKAWPPIYFVSHILKKDDLEFIAVVILGSPLRPHFSGPAFVRVGPESRDASEEQYDELIAERSSTFRALQKLRGKIIHWSAYSAFAPHAGRSGNGKLIDCNRFYLTIDGETGRVCFPINNVKISFDANMGRDVLIFPVD